MDLERAVLDGGEHFAGLGQSAQVDEVSGGESVRLQRGFCGFGGRAAGGGGVERSRRTRLEPFAAFLGTMVGEFFGLIARALFLELFEAGSDGSAEGGEFVFHGAFGLGQDSVSLGLDRIATLGQVGADFFCFLAGEAFGADLVGDGRLARAAVRRADAPWRRPRWAPRRALGRARARACRVVARWRGRWSDRGVPISSR